MADVAEKTHAAPASHKQPSRKGKKAWRKNVDITDFQSGIEDVRDQIIQGGVLAERPAEDLFVTDTTGSDAVKSDFAKRHKSLKADEILSQRSKVAAVDTRKRKQPEGLATGSSKRNKNGTYVSHKDLQHLRSVANGASQTDVVKAPDAAAYDPWGMEPLPKDPRFSFVKEKKPKVAPKTLREAPISLAANGKPFAAVPKPSAGKSYNPAFEDWEAHVTAVGNREVEAERKRLQEAQEEAERLEKALAEAAKPDPPTDDEAESAWESEWEGIQSEAEDSGTTFSKKRPERKTPAQRNKIKRRKEQEHKEKWEKAMKRKEDQQNRVKEIAKELAEKERLLKEQQALQPVTDGNDSASENDEDENEVLRRRTLTKNPIPAAPLEVVLADELQDSLRALRPEGNLLKDRYRNLLVNGKLEARKQVQHKKPRREVTEKWSYKDWKLR